MENWLTSKPDLKAVFFWIKSLTVAQKRDFITKSVIKGRSQSATWKLYEGFNKLAEYDEEVIRGFIPAKNFNRVLKTLIEKLIYWQLSLENTQQPRLSVIQKAIDVGAVELVRRYVVEELDECLQWNRFSQAMVLLEWAEELYQLFGINIRLNNPKPFPDEWQIHEEMSDILFLKRSIGSLRYAFIRPKEEREGLIAYALNDRRSPHLANYYAVEVPDIRKRLLNHSIQARVAILEGDLSGSVESQKEVIDLISSIPQNPIAETLHEVNILVHLYALDGKKGQSMATLEDMRELKPQNPLESTLQFQFIAKAEMGLAERWWDAELATEIFANLLDRPGAFSDQDYPILLYKVALIHFVNGDYRQTLKCLREVFALPLNMKSQMLVWAELLELASHYSLENIDFVDSNLRRVKGNVKESGSEYADLVFRTIKAISHFDAFGFERRVSSSFRDEFHENREKWQETKESWHFDFNHWLEARHQKKTCKELHEANDGEALWNGHLDQVDMARSMLPIFYPEPYFRPFVG